MTKIAKLVCVSLMTRVIVDESATDEQILEQAKSQFITKVHTELHENLESIEDDEEMPYDPEFDGGEVECLNCGFEFILTKMNTGTDDLGKHCVCPKCTASFNID